MSGGSLPWMTRQAVFHRFNWYCLYCGQSAAVDMHNGRACGLTVDHVVPVALGGTDDPWNLASCCLPCNEFKAAKMPKQEVVDLAREAWTNWVHQGMPMSTRDLPLQDRTSIRLDRQLAEWNPPIEEKRLMIAMQMEDER